MRRDVIGGVISSMWADEGEDPKRKGLVRDLARILHRFSDDSRAEFLECSLEAIDEYKKLVLPSLESGFDRDAKMESLAEAGRKFALAVAALDADSRALLRYEQGREVGWHPNPDFSETTNAGEWAAMTAKAAQRLRRRRGDGAPSSMVAPLIGSIAATYMRCTGKRPSAAREGIFARALNTLLAAAALPEQGQTAIGSALENSTKPGWKT